jgi:hypothetical protein
VQTSSARRKSRAPIYVSIVSANLGTLDGLQRYLGDAGVMSHCTRALDDLGSIAPDRATAAVIFPDDFDDREAVTAVRQLRRARPRLLTVLVTREPQRFRDVVQPDGRSLPPLILPKPSFGWDILDAIRAHADAEKG